MQKNTSGEIEEVRQALKDLVSARDFKAAGLIAGRITRAMSHLQRSFPKMRALSMLASDLAELLRSETELAKFEKTKKGPGEGFFKSLAVLVQEFDKVLSTLEEG